MLRTEYRLWILTWYEQDFLLHTWQIPTTHLSIPTAHSVTKHTILGPALPVETLWNLCPVEKLFGMRMAGLCQFYWSTCLFFYGRLLRPWWTEVRESFTRGGPWVSLKKLLLGFFPGYPQTTGWAKKWRNLAYFQTPPANFLLSRPNAAEYYNSEKKTC